MELIFATQNENKVKEIQKLFPPHIVVKSLLDIGCTEDIPETQPTIEGNAIQKADYVAKKYGVNCFSDDTGLEVNALNGEPGVLSARYAGPEKNSANNMNLLLEKLKYHKDRSARFKTVIALLIDGELSTFEGIVEGEIRKYQTGSYGFGYDPIFEPEKQGKTFAEMSMEEKNLLSHRARAIEQLVSLLKGDIRH